VPIVRTAVLRTAPPTSTKVGNGVRPWSGVPGAFLGGFQAAVQAAARPAYEQRLAISRTVPVMQHDGPDTTKAFAARQYQEDP
jgi:hypothetical protein